MSIHMASKFWEASLMNNSHRRNIFNSKIITDLWKITARVQNCTVKVQGACHVVMVNFMNSNCICYWSSYEKRFLEPSQFWMVIRWNTAWNIFQLFLLLIKHIEGLSLLNCSVRDSASINSFPSHRRKLDMAICKMVYRKFNICIE